MDYSWLVHGLLMVDTDYQVKVFKSKNDGMKCAILYFPQITQIKNTQIPQNYDLRNALVEVSANKSAGSAGKNFKLGHCLVVQQTHRLLFNR